MNKNQYEGYNHLCSLYSGKEFSPLTVEEEFKLRDEYQATKSTRLKDRLITSLSRQIIKRVGDFIGYNMDPEDLFQAGIEGVVFAFNRFDFSAENRFITFANFYIDSYIMQYIEHNSFQVKVLTTVDKRKVFWNLNSEISGRTVTDKLLNDIAQKLNVSQESVHEVSGCFQAAKHTSVDEEINDFLDSEEFIFSEAADQSVYEEETIIFESSDNIVIHDEISFAVSELTEQEAFIINNRHLTETPLKLREIAEKFNLSIQRVNAIEINALRKLGKSLPVSKGVSEVWGR
jgi:RNA polymerase sigma-32 factor